MSGWAGFTDAELQRLKGPTGKVDRLQTGARKPSNFTKPKVTSQQKMISQQRKPDLQSNTGQIGVIPPEQRLSKPLVPSNNNTNNEMTGRKTEFTSPNTGIGIANTRDSNGNVEVGDGVPSELSTSVVEEVKELELNQEEVLSHQMSKLEKYQQQQKMIEELNKQRKQLLSKAISERSKKAKAEASKLKHIEKELSHLDNVLAGGVTIIRDRIEQASIAYLEAQHKYDKAEREFINAKIDLHDRAEMKEQLTEHLYTIIHQNEIRKSQKLAELMKELEMEISADEIDMKLDLPPLSSFNTVQTLSPIKSPNSPLHPPTSEKTASESKMDDTSGGFATGNTESKMADTSASTKTGNTESNMADTSASTKTGNTESKMADTSAAPGSEPHSEVDRVDVKTDFQPIKIIERTDVSLIQNAGKSADQISKNLEQNLPKQTEDSRNPLSFTEQESPTESSTSQNISHGISQTKSPNEDNSEKENNSEKFNETTGR